MSDDKASHEVYKELGAALNDLSHDLVRGLVSLRAVAGDNKADIDRVEHRFAADCRRLQGKIEKLQREEGALAAKLSGATGRLAKLERASEARSEVEGKVLVEDKKGRWALRVAVVGGLTGVITAVAQIVMKIVGG